MDKHTQVFSTYSVSLYYDDASAAQLRHAAERISLVTGNNYMIQHSVPPHITLGMFHAAENNLQLLKKVFADFADKAAVFSTVFSFSGVNSFYDKVIFLYPAEEAECWSVSDLSWRCVAVCQCAPDVPGGLYHPPRRELQQRLLYAVFREFR